MLISTKARAGLLALAAALVFAAPAYAQLLNFEDLPGGSTAIGNGYQGFDWSNFYAISRGELPGSGYDNGMLGDRAAYNAYGYPAAISSSSTFDFYSAYIGAAWNDGLTITVRGLLNGAELFSQSLTANTWGAQQVIFNFTGINELHFSSSGGVDSGRGGSGPHLVIDEMNFNAPQTVTPEPVSMALLGTGLAGVAAARRRKKQSSEA